jgi:hypothetical protein
VFAQPMTKTDASAFEAFVLQTWEQYSEYMNEGNVDDWLKLWDVNGVQLAPGSPASEGLAAITMSITAQHAASDFEQFKIRFGIRQRELLVRCDSQRWW